MMSYGFDPYLSSWSPYHGAVYAVLMSLSKIVAAGGDYDHVRFTFQEYFRRMSEEPERWSQPFAALLGSFDAQLGFGLPSIGGKDSMSGTFNDIDVPPTLVSFAVDPAAKTGDIVTPECKEAGDRLLLISLPRTEYDLPEYDKVCEIYKAVTKLEREGSVKAAYAVDGYGVLAAAVHMAVGNGLGLEFNKDLQEIELFKNRMGDLLIEVSPESMQKIAEDLTNDAKGAKATDIAVILEEGKGIIYKDTEISGDEVLRAWKQKLEPVFPTKAYKGDEKLEDRIFDVTKQSDKGAGIYICKNKVAKPTVFIPVFPGTNCEYDSARAFEAAGANAVVKVFRNADALDIRQSVEEFEKAIENAQMIMFPGGFSAGDEPDGSAKFFATAFRNEKIKEAVTKLLNERDGLALGICNGFQALIKLGLVPNGRITGQNEDSPTLTYNMIGRHISKMAYTKVVTNKSPWLAGTQLGTKVVSNLSPWLSLARLGDVYTSPASHGEGRFVAPADCIRKLFENGQVATRYSDPEGNLSMDEEWNINGSFEAVEGITSPDGRCLGKMCHVERRGDGVAVNITGEQDMRIFEAGVKYFG